MTRRQRLTRRRLSLALAAVLAVLSIFGLRLFQIQGVDAEAYAAMAVQAGTAKTTIVAPRGAITDRNGVELATSADGLTITADPSMTAPNATKIARILIEKVDNKLDYFDTVEKLRKPKSRFVYIKKMVPRWTAEKALKEIGDAGYTGIFTEPESLRSYPGGSLAANLLGYLDASGKGVAGIEQMYNEQLTGKDGTKTFEVSPTGQRIPMADSTVENMVPGNSVRTTIDRDLQWYADQRLAGAVRSASADWGLAITMDIKTGQIVQMSQSPTYDADAGTGLNAYNTVNRAVQTVYEPGSVQKVLTMAALANEGKITPQTKIKVPGKLVFDGFPIGDYWEHGTLNLTAAGVIAKSSNLGTIVAAAQLSNKEHHDYLAKFGLGKATTSGLPGESAGILNPAEDWTAASKATIAFGQGVSVTALQMVQAVGAIANGGVLVEPSIVSGYTDADGNKTASPEPKRTRVVSKKSADMVTTMMEAVTAPDGTAPAAAIKGYRVAGKTGTAWRVNPVTGKYVRGQNTISFIGFAPADKPRFLTYIVLDNPFRAAGGGSVGGPVFHDILSMALERFGIAPTGSKVPKIKQDW